ncbi:MAG: helix-turn-helix domain-containing protein [Treponema sp.]|jgi:excisionase family DNA binding protein|nr:helix-turn-helix domain-containing protein [Treponema sp.]
MAEILERPMGIVEAAAFTGLSKNYLYKLVYLKKIPFYKPNNGRIFFKQEELEQFIFRGRTSADYEVAEKADRVLNKSEK